MELFPLNAGISELRGLIKLIKDNGSAIEISELAKEAETEIDALLPLIDACRLLGLCRVSDGSIKLTDPGVNLTMRNVHDVLKKSLVQIEPFKSSFAILNAEKSVTTERLSELLGNAGITLYTEKVMNAELLKKLLLKWCVRLKLFAYDPKADEWSIA